jgi:hypothetical protein
MRTLSCALCPVRCFRIRYSDLNFPVGLRPAGALNRLICRIRHSKKIGEQFADATADPNAPAGTAAATPAATAAAKPAAAAAPAAAADAKKK